MLLVRLVLLVFLTQLIACRPDRDEEEEFELDNDGNHFRKFSTILKKATKKYPESIPAHLCTHILYAFATISGTSITNTMENDINTVEGQKVCFLLGFVQ